MRLCCILPANLYRLRLLIMTDPPPPTKTYTGITILCWLVIVGIVRFILVKNTVAYDSLADRRLPSAVPPPDISLEITSRMLIGQTSLVSRLPGAKDPALISRQRERMLVALNSATVTPADALNAVPVIAELAGSDSAIVKLDQLQGKLTPNPALDGDAEALRVIYTQGLGSVSASQRQGLLQRHEWFAQLALSFGLPDQDRQRQAVLDAAIHTTIVLGIVFIAMLAALSVGLVLLIVGLVFLEKGRLRFNFRPAPTPGPPVYLETFAIWLAVWMAISFLFRLLGVQHGILTSEAIAALFSLGVALWPLCRGINWSQFRAELGWHSGRGALREIFAGLIGYIAGLPILAVGFLITAMLIQKSGSHPTHPILRELMGKSSALTLIGIYLAACLLAPLIEETMFRGALYQHLRRRHRPILSALIVSLLFAAIHPQGWAVIPLLGSIAFVLAMLREWRSSLLASMTAHALNNAIGVSIVILLLRSPA
jgi:membrane protease YdiL (CAAX protease family)